MDEILYTIFAQVDDNNPCVEDNFESRTDAQTYFDLVFDTLTYLQDSGALGEWADGESGHVVYLVLVKRIGDVPEDWPILRVEKLRI